MISLLIIFLSVALLIAVIGVCVFLRPWRTVAAYREPEPSDSDGAALPGVSVVTYALRDTENLSDYLDIILRQDYPDFEVIVVCDATAEATATISEKFADVGNLHITFIPPGSHSLSRRKLAQTVGIKAASKDVVVITSTSVTPQSDEWLRRLATPLADPDTSLSLGYIHYRFDDFHGAGRWYRQFDSLLTSAQWLDSAISGHPYRGDGFNLAFRRHLFFDNKGYASSITYMDGDDDIFIHEIASTGGCAVTLDPDSIVESHPGREANRLHDSMKARYMFTRRHLPALPFLIASMAEWTNWLLLILCALLSTCAAIFLPHIYDPAPDHTRMLAGVMSAGAALICILIALAFYISEIIIYRRLANRLGAVRLFWAVVPFMLWRPFGNLIFRFRRRSSRRAHYVWEN